MKINHIAIWAYDIERLKDFYILYFNGIANKKYINANRKFESYFISFENDCKLEIMNIFELKNELNQYAENKLGLAHLAFSVGSEKLVDELTERLKVNGYRVLSNPRLTGDRFYESTILDPENNIIEITV